MKNGICPVCQSSEIYKKKNAILVGDGFNVYINVGRIHKTTDVDCFICAYCGYIQVYVLDRERLQEISQTWEKVVKY